MDVIAQDQPTKITASNVLKDYYGFDAFRAQQEDIVNDLTAGQDLLVLMPTGAENPSVIKSLLSCVKVSVLSSPL